MEIYNDNEVYRRFPTEYTMKKNISQKENRDLVRYEGRQDKSQESRDRN